MATEVAAFANPRRDTATHTAHRRVVVPTADSQHRLGRVHHRRNSPCVLGQLLLGQGFPLPDPVLLTVHQRVLRALRQPPRCLAGTVPGVDPVGMLVMPFLLALPNHLLLLPQGLLPVGVAVPHQLRNPRAARPLYRRKPASADHPQQPPVLLLHRLPHRVHHHLRRDHRISLPFRLRVRFGQHRSRGQRVPAVLLHRWLPFMPTPHWRPTHAFLQTPGPVLALNESHLVQRTAHAVRVDHPGHAGTHRLLHHAGGQRYHQRSEIHWLTANPRTTDDELTKHPGRRS